MKNIGQKLKLGVKMKISEKITPVINEMMNMHQRNKVLDKTKHKPSPINQIGNKFNQHM